MRLNFPVANSIFAEKFSYNHLVYRTNNLNITHKLSHKVSKAACLLLNLFQMLKTGYLCIKAKLESVDDLDKFSGWGLHILDPMINGINVDFITDEIKVSPILCQHSVEASDAYNSVILYLLRNVHYNLLNFKYHLNLVRP